MAASVAAAGLAAGPAGAASSGKVYACYSDTTKALYHATSSKCKSGFTSISWNEQGPQGAQGALGSQGSQGAQGSSGAQGSQGAQGAAAPVNAYTDINKSNKTVSLKNAVSTVVASFTPSASASYAVDAAATAGPKANSTPEIQCYDRSTGTSHFEVTQLQSAYLPLTPYTVMIPTNGILKGGPTKPIEEVCRAIGSATAKHAQITGTQLSAGHGSAGAAAAPRNSFALPRKLERTAVRRSLRKAK